MGFKLRDRYANLSAGELTERVGQLQSQFPNSGTEVNVIDTFYYQCLPKLLDAHIRPISEKVDQFSSDVAELILYQI